MKPKLSILIPFRDDGTRGRQFKWVVERFTAELPEAEVIVSADDGQDPFNLSLARNNAFRKSTTDIMMIVDADIYATPESVRAAVKNIEEGANGVYSNRLAWLTEEATERLLTSIKPSDPLPSFTYADISEIQMAPWNWLMVSRDTYSLLGGYDERFRGWGHEDKAFECAFNVMVGPAARRGYDGFALYHHRIKKGRTTMWVGQTTRNKKFVVPYLEAKTKEQMAILVDENRRRNGFT